MLTTSSIKSFVLLASVMVFARGEPTEACGGGEWWGISDLTTFDPKVVDAPEGLYYEPSMEGFGGACDDCIKTAMVTDWRGYLGAGITAPDWSRVLLEASTTELASFVLRLNGKTAAPPKGWEHNTLFKAPAAAKDRLIAAITFVQLARKLEAFASFSAYDADGNQRKGSPPPEDLLAQAKAGAKSRDPFLAQRYAFQVVRALFYRRDWPAVIAFHDQWAKVLAAPSVDLGWRARYYAAGALARNGNKARANLELSRIHVGYAPLAGQAAQEFAPMEDRDWRETLKLARTPREKTELWRLVGLKKDGLVAAQEIIKLDPKSPHIGLLLVRELARAESHATDAYGPPDPAMVAAQTKMYARLEQLAIDQLAKQGDRPWLMELIAGHIAAKRGDLVTARQRLARAAAGKPGDARVGSQAKASLALALVANWKITPQLEDELATNMNGLHKDYGRLQAVQSAVRGKIAKDYLAVNRFVDAEFLKPGTVTAKWTTAAFIKDMLARLGRTQTAFDRFVVAGAYTKAGLEQDLAMRHVLDGDFAAAATLYQRSKPASAKLGTDPFVNGIKDCHDCDHEKYANAAHTHGSVVARLAELQAKVKQGGEAGADAALTIGNVLYNMTYWGNARVMLSETHQATNDATAAIGWYKRAHDLAKNRELKAKAAFFAAKAELGNLLAKDGSCCGADLPVPKTWFPIVKQYANTRYYKEVLAECGHFAAWAGKRK